MHLTQLGPKRCSHLDQDMKSSSPRLPLTERPNGQIFLNPFLALIKTNVLYMGTLESNGSCSGRLKNVFNVTRQEPNVVMSVQPTQNNARFAWPMSEAESAASQPRHETQFAIGLIKEIL